MKTLKSLIFLLLFIALGCSLNSDPPPPLPPTVVPADYLTAATYPNLIVEIDYVQGFQLSPATLTNLQNFLQQRLNKPGGIVIKQNQLNVPGKEVYSLTDIATVEGLLRSQSVTATTLSVFVFVADKDFIGDGTNTKYLGLVYGPTSFASGITSIALFEKTILDFSGGAGQPTVADLESTVLLHQFGHLFGLVNFGTPMVANHADALDPLHCDDPVCLMNYKGDISDVANNLNGVPALTASCLNDLKANGGL